MRNGLTSLSHYAVDGIDAEYLDDPQRIHCLRILGIWDIVALDFKTTAISDAASKLSAYMKNMYQLIYLIR